MSERLVYIASNHKGDGLFKELAKRFSDSRYHDAGYSSLPLALHTLSQATRRLKNRPLLDRHLRKAIARRAWRWTEDLFRSIGREPLQIVCWQCLFPLTCQWRQFGQLSVISDVPMTEVYFRNFGITNRAAKVFRYRLRETTLENCDHFFTHSEWAADVNKKLHPLHAEKISRIGWGSDMPVISREEAIQPRSRLQVLCVGNDYMRKGADLYDQVAERLKRRIPGLECLMVGTPGNGFPVTKLRHLTVLGRLPRQKLAELFKDASLFALFSRFEPAGHVTGEAMSSGVPVICSNEGGIAEPVVNGKTGFVCDPFSADMAVDRACSILTQPATLASFREQAYDHATSSWLWSHVADRIVCKLEGLRLSGSSH